MGTRTPVHERLRFYPFTKGAGNAGLDLHSTNIQTVAEEYATRRTHARKVKLRWRVSGGPRWSLGWIPFKASALRYCNGQLFNGKTPLSLWDSYGLGGYELGAGSFSEDTRGRWYINICVKLPRLHGPSRNSATKSVGIDLGLKDFAALSDGHVVAAERHYRKYDAALAKAQRARKMARVRAIHAKIKNSRKDQHHKLSTALVEEYGAIFIGNLNAPALARRVARAFDVASALPVASSSALSLPLPCSATALQAKSPAHLLHRCCYER